MVLDAESLILFSPADKNNSIVIYADEDAMNTGNSTYNFYGLNNTGSIT